MYPTWECILLECTIGYGYTLLEVYLLGSVPSSGSVHCTIGWKECSLLGMYHPVGVYTLLEVYPIVGVAFWECIPLGLYPNSWECSLLGVYHPVGVYTPLEVYLFVGVAFWEYPSGSVPQLLGV